MNMGRDWNHTKLKIATFERDKYTCIKCKHIGKKGFYNYGGGRFIDLVADHIIPLKLDGKNELDNMQTLCLECNKIKNAQDQSNIAKRKREKNGINKRRN